jgi:hypothetical protein
MPETTTVRNDWDALIPGIYNYCDRWCERCRLSERCLVYRQEQGTIDMSTMPINSVVIDALGDEHVVGGTGCAEPRDAELERELEESERRMQAASEDPLVIQAQGYTQLTLEWLGRLPEPPAPSPSGAPARPPTPEEVIAQFYLYIGAKVYRAVLGALEKDDGAEAKSDANGSAKAALLAIRRSEVAWMNLKPKGPGALRTAIGLVEVLGALREGLEARFPKAYAFVRPGFDEPGQARGVGR